MGAAGPPGFPGGPGPKVGAMSLPVACRFRPAPIQTGIKNSQE